jgi:hypothetical protein
MITGGYAFLALPVYLFSLAFLTDWIEKGVYDPAGVSRLRVALSAASSLLFMLLFVAGAGWPDWPTDWDHLGAVPFAGMLAACSGVLAGGYLLRTDRTELTAQEAWLLYMTLTRAENAFRAIKTPLAERPIFHHLEHRVETHIFLCILAYHLLVAIETTLLNKGVHTSWATVRETLANHNVATMVLPTDGGKVLCIRKGTTPEPDQLELDRLLKISAEPMHPIKTWWEPSSPGHSD